MAHRGESVTVKNPKRLEQIQNTRNDFQTALLLILKEKRLETIKVAALSEKAGYSRRTFYRHYIEIGDILREISDQKTLQLFKEIKALPRLNFMAFCHFFFQYWYEEKAFLLILRDNQILYWLNLSWSKHIDKSALINHRHFNHIYQQQFAIGAMFQLLQAWVNNDCTESPEEMTTICENILQEFGKES